MQTNRIIAVLTSFNRRSMTLACLVSAEVAARRAGVELLAVLVDDASTDGTAEAVRARFPWVEVITGSGSLFWNQGMHRAYTRALEIGAAHYLWINEDTELVEDALSVLLAHSRDLERRLSRPVIVVGSTAERNSHRITYGGSVARSRLRRFTYDLVWSEREPLPCETINGNCVLISHEAARRVGNLDPAYEHAMGDTDYGLRAVRAGVGVYVAAGIAGYCSHNPTAGTHFDLSLPFRKRWRLLTSRKGLPVRSWLHFTRRHGGVLWPLYFAWPYARFLWSGMRHLHPRRRSS